MSQPSRSREMVFVTVLGLTALVWLMRGLGLLTFLPGFILWGLMGLSIALILINGFIEIR